MYKFVDLLDFGMVRFLYSQLGCSSSPIMLMGDFSAGFHFFSGDLHVSTAFSYCPLDWLDVLCSICHSFVKWANSVDKNCGPLSEFRVSGIPCLANRTFDALIIAFYVVGMQWFVTLFRLVCLAY